MSESVIETAPADATATPEAESAEVIAQSEGTPAVDAQATADAVDPVKNKISFKRKDGTPVEFESEDALLAALEERDRLSTRRKEYDRAASERFEYAAKIQRQLESLKESDPEEYFKLRGVDPIQFAVEKLQREVALRDATPEQRALYEAQARIQALEAQQQTQEQQQQQAQAEQQKQQFVARLDKELPPAVQRHGLPTDPLVFRAVANVIADQIRNGMPEDPDGAAELVADAYRSTFKQHAATLKYEDAVKQYPEFVKLVREGDLARARTVTPAPARPVVTSTGAPKKPAEPAPSGSQKFNNYFDDWAGLGISRPG